MSDSKALLLVTMEPPAGLEEEFNDWYDSEHYPQRCALPGFESAARFVCIEGWPRWLALYDLTSADALETPEYRAVSGPNSTPWSRRILPRTLGRTRAVAEQIAPGNALMLPGARVSRLVLARFPQLAPGRETELADSLRSAGGKIDGILQLRLFASMAGTGRDLWVIAECGRPDNTGALARAMAGLAESGPDLLNVYIPYWRS